MRTGSAGPADVPLVRHSYRTNRKFYSVKQESPHSALNYMDFQAFLSCTSQPRGQPGSCQFKKKLLQFSLNLFSSDLGYRNTITSGQDGAFRSCSSAALQHPNVSPVCWDAKYDGATRARQQRFASTLIQSVSAWLQQLKISPLWAVQHYSWTGHVLRKDHRRLPNQVQSGTTELRSLIYFLWHSETLKNLKIFSKLHWGKTKSHLCACPQSWERHLTSLHCCITPQWWLAGWVFPHQLSLQPLPPSACVFTLHSSSESSKF